MVQWTILKLLEWTIGYFADHDIPNARLDAELLLCEVLALKRMDLYLNFDKPVAPSDLARFKTMIQRRAKREPLQYVLGHADFFGRRFSVTPDVLIPRPETEQLVARALEWLDAHPSAIQVLDFGTGSGCIAITLALKRPRLQVTAVDVSEAALEVARRNAKRLCVSTDVRICVQNNLLFTHTRTSAQGVYDLIISNPPYIPSAEIARLQPEVALFEPLEALDGGTDGLVFCRQLLSQAPEQLRPGGALAMEIGAGQGPAILDIATATEKWQRPQCYKDLAGTERIFVFETAGCG